MLKEEYLVATAKYDKKKNITESKAIAVIVKSILFYTDMNIIYVVHDEDECQDIVIGKRSGFVKLAETVFESSSGKILNEMAICTEGNNNWKNELIHEITNMKNDSPIFIFSHEFNSSRDQIPDTFNCSNQVAHIIFPICGSCKDFHFIPKIPSFDYKPSWEDALSIAMDFLNGNTDLSKFMDIIPSNIISYDINIETYCGGNSTYKGKPVIALDLYQHDQLGNKLLYCFDKPGVGLKVFFDEKTEAFISFDPSGED